MDHVQGVLFDLDGVLVDSRIPFARSINAALVANELAPRPEPSLHNYLGPPLHRTFGELTDDPSLVQPCVDAYRVRYRKHAAQETSVFAGIPKLLAWLSQRVPLAVATSKPRALAEPLLESLGLRSYFIAVAGPELDVEDERKAVTMRRALRALPDPTGVVAVGDRKYDVTAARGLGLQTIGILWGIGSEDELSAAGADALARTPAELKDLLEAGDVGKARNPGGVS